MNKTEMDCLPKNMRTMGMLLFRDGFLEALFSDKLISLVHVAHSAEILLKARIAQEDPLQIFSQIPKVKTGNNALKLIDLIENGQTLKYSSLPDRLWETTGIKIEPLSLYKDFGKLRNQIVHISMTTREDELDKITAQYSLELLDPLVEKFWGRSVIDFIVNDPMKNSIIPSGELELAILEKGFSINERLRCFLGEGSKEGLKYIKQLQKQAEFNSEEISTSLSQDNPEQYSELIKDLEGWEDFVRSF